jgi:iron complex outermembrane receptor protein
MWQATDWLALRGGVGTTFRGPPPQNLNSDIVALQLISNAFRAVDVLGNPDLAPETATTFNAGAMIDSGGFRASLDWWRYDFSGAIESEPVAGIVTAMFGSTGTANCGNPAYAALQARFTFSGACAAANIARMETHIFNSSDVSTSGLDFQLAYEGDLGREGAFELGVAGTYTIEYKVDDVTVEGILVQPAFDAVGLLNYQTTAFPLPPWKGQAWLQGELGAHLLRLQANYIDGYTDQRGAAIFGPNAGALAGAAVIEGKQIGAFVTVDATWRLRLEWGTTIALSLLNIFDKDPPFARLDQNYDPLTANPLGFTAKLGVSQEF